MEYDSPYLAQALAPVMVVAAVVASFIVGVIVYVIALAPQTSSNMARPNGVSL